MWACAGGDHRPLGLTAPRRVGAAAPTPRGTQRGRLRGTERFSPACSALIRCRCGLGVCRPASSLREGVGDTGAETGECPCPPPCPVCVLELMHTCRLKHTSTRVHTQNHTPPGRAQGAQQPPPCQPPDPARVSPEPCPWQPGRRVLSLLTGWPQSPPMWGQMVPRAALSLCCWGVRAL